MTTSTRTRGEAAAPAARDARVAKLLDGLRADPKLAAVVRDFERRAATAAGARKFGSNGLKAGDKLFALFTQGTLVVKLPKERVAELVDAKLGTPFDPGHGRLMKEWLTVVSPKASWKDLTLEAFAYVSGSPPRRAGAAR
jgi:hypothetical protein